MSSSRSRNRSLPSLSKTKISFTAFCSSHGRDLVHHRCRSSTFGSCDRLLCRTPQLGTELGSPSPLCRPGRRNLTRWYSVDLLPPSLLLVRAGARPLLPPLVLDISTTGFRLWQVAVLLFTCGTARSAGFQPSSRSGAKREAGCLRQATLSRTTASGRQRRPLTHRVAISNHRIVGIEDGQVKLKWRDYRGRRVHPETPAPCSA
jgi:Putative transposase